MTGFDIIVKVALSTSDAQMHLAAVFALNESEVLVAEDYPEHFPDNAKVFCMLHSVKGDFSTHLSVDGLGGFPVHASTVSQQFSESVGSDCLISDDSPSSYTMILISPGKAPKPVFLQDAADPDVFRLEV